MSTGNKIKIAAATGMIAAGMAFSPMALLRTEARTAARIEHRNANDNLAKLIRLGELAVVVGLGAAVASQLGKNAARRD